MCILRLIIVLILKIPKLSSIQIQLKAFGDMPNFHYLNIIGRKILGGYLAKHMFLKQTKNKNDALIEFFKLAGHLYNANVPINVEQNSSDTDDNEETDEETDDNIVY